ncbi:UNVERIFIED_CONTAM: hypothetical protein PYX00_001095 [Menopon gallinae]|uniref:BLOC-1-related complex subunit 6 C-terminal helix domain-containing protein n=1 Tax=Menopon gallinae TaxID=328185 RepID=A0AAW2ICU3_9NEOP
MDQNCISDFDQTKGGGDMDDSIRQITESYSEISIDSNDSDCDVDSFIFQKASPKACNSTRPGNLDFQTEKQNPSTLEFLHSAGTVEQDGDMVLFFSEDLETKIKLSSPGSKQESLLGCGDISKSSAPCLYRQALQPSIPPLDATVLNALEADARKVATAVDSLTENLAGLLHSVSALTVDCLETYRDAVCNTCDAVDSNIKSMYQLMAKCEELSKTMRPVYQLAEQIKEIKRLLDLYENAVTT